MIIKSVINKADKNDKNDKNMPDRVSKTDDFDNKHRRTKYIVGLILVLILLFMPISVLAQEQDNPTPVPSPHSESLPPSFRSEMDGTIFHHCQFDSENILGGIVGIVMNETVAPLDGDMAGQSAQIIMGYDHREMENSQETLDRLRFEGVSVFAITYFVDDNGDGEYVLGEDSQYHVLSLFSVSNNEIGYFFVWHGDGGTLELMPNCGIYRYQRPVIDQERDGNPFESGTDAGISL